MEEIGFATPGCVLCHPDSQITQARKLRATVFAFDTLASPMTKGFPAVLYAHGAVEPCVVSKLLHVVNSSGEIQKDKPAPRALTAGKAASIIITLDRACNCSLCAFLCLAESVCVPLFASVRRCDRRLDLDTYRSYGDGGVRHHQISRAVYAACWGCDSRAGDGYQNATWLTGTRREFRTAVGTELGIAFSSVSNVADTETMRRTKGGRTRLRHSPFQV